MNLEKQLEEKHTWLVTGCAGFIGSHMTQWLLSHGQRVRGIDDLSTGSRANIDAALNGAGQGAGERFEFFEGDILDDELLAKAANGARFALHFAAVASVPRSIDDPRLTSRVNVEGFAAVARAAVEGKIQRVVYASSSAVYGEGGPEPRREDMAGDPLSPYAASKMANELFASAFTNCYETEFIGLRYFNVFGPRQDPKGPYAAVIPLWMDTLIEGKQAHIYGDPEISRDFTFVGNVVEANALAALADPKFAGKVYNIADGKKITLGRLLGRMASILKDLTGGAINGEPVIDPPRIGDIKHSLADISRARKELGFEPKTGFDEGLEETIRKTLKAG